MALNRSRDRRTSYSRARVWFLAAATAATVHLTAVAPAAAQLPGGQPSWTDQAVVPAGHHYPFHGNATHGPSFAGPPFGTAAYAGPQYGPPEQVFNGPYCEDAYVKRKLIPDAEDQYGPRPPLFGHHLSEGIRARIEYRNYYFSDPGFVPIGAPQVPTEISPFFNITTLNESVNDLAQAYDTDDFDFEGVNAIAGTLIFPTLHGSIEIDGMTTEQSSASFVTRSQIRALPIDPLTGLSQAELVRPAIPLLNGGVESASLAIPLDELAVSNSVELFGAGATWVMRPLTPNVPITSSITIGGRYFNYTDNFKIRGQFTQTEEEIDLLTGDITTTSFSVSPKIDSRAINHVFGPTLGLRFDAPSRYLSLGIEPRFGFGISRRVERVRSSDLLTPAPGTTDDVDLTADPTVRVRENEEADLAPFFELNVYGRAHVRENFSVFVGYNLIALSRMSTAARQIEYDSANNDALINLDQDTRSVIVHGLMVGGEYVFD